MPSSLTAQKRGVFERGRRADALGKERYEEVVRGPWLGYVPDIEAALTPYNAMVGPSNGLFARGEVLVPDVGWTRVDAPRLPLGDDGAGVGTVPATRAQFVNHLGFFNRQPLFENEIIAITRDGGGGGELSNVFRLGLDVLNWTTVPPRGGYAVPTLPGTFGPWSLGDNDFVDDAVLSTGFTQTPAGHYAGAAGRGVVPHAVYFFVNENNPVAVWPSFRGGVVDEYDYPIEAIGTHINFSAATCEAVEGRMCYGNITTDLDDWPQRMWFSAIGDGAAIGTGVVGAGYKDATEMFGRLLRLLRIGDHVAGYFESGIVLYQRTFNPLDPFNLVYVTNQVNALSKRSVCALERDRHFIIAEQGWFLLDSSGQMAEVGLADGVRKWQDTFYNNLNIPQARHISTVYDPSIDSVQISFPSRNSEVADTVWLYDSNLDRVFPMADFGAQRIQSQLVAASTITAALTWDEMLDPWDVTPGTWESFSARRGFRVRFHGDRNGYVYVRDQTKVFAREATDGTDVQPGFVYRSPKRPTPEGAPWEWAEANRIEAEYINLLGSSLTLAVNVDGRTVSAVRSAQGVAVGETGIAYVAIANVGGTHHEFTVSAQAPAAIRGFRYVITPVKGERKVYQS